MRKMLLNLFKMVMFGLVFSCAMTVFAQTGGYRSISVDDEGVKAAADFAIKAKSKETDSELSLESIEKAEVQVVAGRNYRLCMSVYFPAKDETDGVTVNIQAVIYQNLKKEYQITKWEELETSCDEQ